MPTATSGSLDELRQLLGEFDTAMLSTLDPRGHIRARPMAIQDGTKRPHCDLWFVTSIESPKAHEIEADQRVGVACYRAKDRSYLSISGTAKLRRDQAEIERLFQTSWKAWFPKGPKDPDIVLLDVTVDRADYWEPEGGRARVMYEMIRAVLSGQAADERLNPPKHIG